MFNPWSRQPDDKQSGGEPSDSNGSDEAGTGAERNPDADVNPNPELDQVGTLEAEIEELKDRHLRLAAEFENFRKRTRKELADGSAVAQAELVARILPTLDDLARVADTPHETTSVQALDEGIELILRNLRKQLADAGLNRIEALDERFDPERHQAIMTSETDEPDEDETVSRVLQDGYEFQGRLVRPAQVEVRHHSADEG